MDDETYRRVYLDYEERRAAAGARVRRDDRAFLADLEPAWTPALIASQPYEAVQDLIFLGVQALMTRD
jgi:hypothetical protein